jgi:pyruvate-formate lyase-activating enzyme
MLYADSTGQVYDHPRFDMAVWDGFQIREPREDELIPLPDGSDLYVLPGRLPLGFVSRKGHLTELAGENEGDVVAVSAFLAPAYLRLTHPAYRTLPGARTLPLFAYAPVGWADGRFWTTALRIDPEPRQDPPTFDLRAIRSGVDRDTAALPGNHLLRQLRRCALEYKCRAAQNFFLGRYECPLPTAPACNANCVGCISHQDGDIPVTQERVETSPPAEDVAAVVDLHFRRARNPIASFGQGCEGEPLTRAQLLLDAVRRVREKHPAGTLNLNSNASRPDVVEDLCRSGLDSIRVSMNSPTQALYEKYHRPVDYSFASVVDSIRRAKAASRFVSLNLLVFPGMTDRGDEVAALKALIAEHSIDMIQWRNLNLDPEHYLDAMGRGEEGGAGLLAVLADLRTTFPTLRHGYFNPFLR